jgi:hypothetical protein
MGKYLRLDGIQTGEGGRGQKIPGRIRGKGGKRKKQIKALIPLPHKKSPFQIPVGFSDLGYYLSV